MSIENEFIDSVLSRIPLGARRDQIEMDLRAHLAERVDSGQTIEEAIRQFGDPELLAESYLASIPLVPASFMSRAAAKLIDIPGILLAACGLVWLAWRLIGPTGESFLESFSDQRMLLIGIAVGILVIPGYFVAAEYMTGQTLGKRAMGLHVVRESGARISLGQSLLRQLPLIGEFFFLDVLFALFTEKKQRAFELITKTRVVRVEEEPA
jgi:uncharacterized RDD family membrane protein YckC